MNAAEVEALLEEHGAIRRGHFELSGGLHSDVFVQTALVLCHPGIAERLGHELGGRFAGLGVTCVLSPAVAGIVIGHEVARYLDCRHIYAERVGDLLTLRRGFRLVAEERVLVVDNAVTDGASKRELVDLARGAGAKVVGVGVIVDRSGGASLGVPLESLLRLATVEWPPEACPLCQSGSIPEAPGSRRLAR